MPSSKEMQPLGFQLVVHDYDAWITEWLENNKAYGNCAVAVTQLRAQFPELREVRGHVYTPWGKRAHWWTVTPEGAIVDPTASQFPGIMSYEPWVPGTPVRVGKCMNCGEEIWRSASSLDTPPDRESVCSPECEESLREYLD